MPQNDNPMKNKLINFFKHFFLIDDSPHKVAGGAALGIFLGIIPGEGFLTTLFFAWLFRLNRLSALAGVAATNMWTTIAILPLTGAIGGFIFHQNANDLINSFQQNYHLGFRFFISKAIFFDLLLPLIIGFIIIAGLIALVFYLVIFLLLKYRKIKFGK